LELALTPSEENQADIFTREDGINDLRLGRKKFLEIWKREGPFDFDVMASSENVQKNLEGKDLKFFSRYLTDGTEGVDIFKQDLSRVRRGFCFPPFCLVGAVLGLFEEQGFSGVCLVPENGAYWTTILNERSSWVLSEPGEKNVFQVLNKQGKMVEKCFKYSMRVYSFSK
jgi:hypothetical protein